MIFQHPVQDYTITQTYWTPWFYNKSVFHRGIDYVKPERSNIYAAMDGVVTRVGYAPDYGHFIEVAHRDGFSTLYAHGYSKPKFIPGEAVTTSDVIMLVGSTGASTGPHVHFELRLEGKKINPAKYQFLTHDKYMDIEKEVGKIKAAYEAAFGGFRRVADIGKLVYDTSYGGGKEREAGSTAASAGMVIADCPTISKEEAKKDKYTDVMDARDAMEKAEKALKKANKK